ncbi:UNVERIFIED_ORG: filamentous hemagglutinin [Pseudomonas fluorescens]|uniref:hemagglutinin repeat-containing protein n=1 Tax=unclassified Pseudomonas TaxID=196821 RepID=UPI000A1EF091|nr:MULTISPECIES: hemagglutinin repeat-containing protein [unclassified Pseudomonas]MDP9711126.1 filamentous hemagglutinin [Pseudomonas fluorescens]
MDVRQYAFIARQSSADVEKHEHFWGMPKRGLAFLLANVMFWQPMWAQADGIVVANPGTSLGQAGNGVPIVNIATPNAVGLSHNQFHDYNVGAQGVILNNVAAQTGQTQLGGIIVGNPNLTNRVAAQAILNEVISGNPSQLRGYTEVAGQSARVIVANPYGITCNGCGFINSPRVTLTTGKPVIDGMGRLDRFQVDQGSVAIEGAGLNASNVDRFEIITRSAKINAEIQAQNLTIVAGRNDVNAQTLDATERADDGSSRPQLAIDSSALGGMYAGAIKLVGTEAGVGVKLAGNLAASGGDIRIDANGQLTLAQVSAANAVNIKASSLDAQGPVYAGTSANVQTQGNLTNQQTLAARDSINLSAGGQLTNNGIVEAGVNADNTRNNAGDVNLSAGSLGNVNKSVLASRNLTVNVGQTLNNQGGTLSSQNTRVSASTLDNQNKGRVLSTGALSLNVGQALNGGGLINSTGSLDATIGQFNNRGGELSSLQDATLRMGSLDNVAGLVNAGRALSITATGAINNQNGRLTSLDSLSLKAGHVDNSNKGRIASNKALAMNAASLDQHDGGQLTSDTSLMLDLNNGDLNNQNGLINAPLLVLKNLRQVDNRNGEISSAQAFTLAAASLDNSNGKLLGNQALTLHVQQALTNIKGLIAAAGIDAQTGSLNNNGGTFTSRADLSLRADGRLDNQDRGLINATRVLDITAASVNNQNGGSLLGSAIAIDFSGAMGDLDNSKGLITTKGQLSISHLRDLNNQGGEFSSDLSYTLAARNMDNSDGKLFSRQRLDLNAESTRNLNGLISGWQGLSLLGGSLDNRNHGTLSSRDGDLLVDLTGDIRNSNTGALVSKGALKVNAGSLDNSDSGVLSSESAQTLTLTGTLNNAQGGLIDSGADLGITAKRLDNTKATINAKQDIRFIGTDLDNTEGVLASDAAVNLDLLGTLINTKGQVVAAGPLAITRAAQINNQGGKLVSQKLLSLSTGGLDNRNGGTVAANDNLTLTASGAVQNSGGLIYSDAADLQLNAASLDNAGGSLQSEGALTVKVGGAIDNQKGRLVAKSGNLDVTAASLDSRGGVLSSLKSAFTAQIGGLLRNGQGGVIQAQHVTLKALAGLDNESGRIAAQSGDTTLDLGNTGNFINRNGVLVARQRVSVTGRDFDNSGDTGGQIAGQQIDLSLRGALNNRKGIIESASTLSVGAASVDNQTGQLRALGNTGKTAFTVGGLFDNRNGAVESANSDFSLGAGGLLNAGGNVLHVGSGIFDIATAQLGSAGGSFVTRGALTLAADSWTNASVIQADRLTVNINNLNQTASGQLLAASKLTGSGGYWNNDGLIASDGSLDLTLWGNYSGNGRTSSLGDLTLKSSQLTLGAGTSIGGGGNTTVNINGLLSNQGRLTSSGDLTLTAATVNNYGTLGAGKDLTLTTGALLNDRGLITSGGDMRLLLSSFTNAYGNVYGLSNVHIGRDRDSGKADLLDNRSGEIYSAQDLTINALTVNNVRDILEYTAHEKSSVVITQIDCNLIPIAGCDFRSGGRRNGHWEIAETDRLKVDNSSAAASLTSGGNMSINAQALNNASSTIAATGNINVTAGTITNKGLQEQEIITKRTYWNYVDQIFAAEPAAKAFNDKNGGTPSATVEADLSHFISLLGGGKLTESVSTVTGSGSSYDAVIQAGGNIRLDAAQTIDNSVVRPYYSYVAAGKTNTDTGVGNGYSTVVKINPQLPPDLAQQQVSPIDLPGFSLPTGQNGLFRLSQEGGSAPATTGPQSWTLSGGKVTGGVSTTPVTVNRVQGLPSNAGKSQPHKYLIETNPVLTDLKQFMSSDYLLQGLGYDADQSAKRLGDGLFEQKLVQQAVVARTGQRFIDGQTSDEGVFKYLMDNAIASKNTLNLSVGVSLSAQQVAALTHDIVWLEEREVNGEKVLVPVLYLANANNRLAATGSLIQGKDVTLIAGENLENSGTLRASQNLDATAKKDLVSSGLVEAGNLLKLTATDNLTNKAGGIISGRDVTLTAERGDVINERTVTTHRSSDGRLSEETDFVDNAARIEAANALVIGAGRDINNSGSVLKSGGDTTLTAGRDVHIDSTEQTTDRSNTNYQYSTVKQHGSDVNVGGTLKVTAQRDVSVVASNVEAKGNVDINAKGDLTISSAADESHASGWNKKFRAEEDHVAQQSSVIKAGGSLTLNADKDLNLIASHVKSGGEAFVYAGDDLNLLTADNLDHSFYTKTKKGDFGKKKSVMTESESITSVSSSIESGSKLVMSAGQDINAQGAKVRADGTLLATAGHDINLDVAEDYASQASASSKKNWKSSKSNSAEATQTRLNSTEWVAKSMELKADNDITLKAASLRAADEIKLTAANDVFIGAAQETQTSSQSQSSSKTGATITGLLSNTQKSQQGQQTSTESIGSDISAGSLQIKSGRDTVVEGSTLVADKNIGINAGRNLEVISAENTTTASSSSGNKKVGEIGSWWQGATGIVKTKESDQSTTTRQSGSQIASLGGNILLTAGDHYTQTASQLVTPVGDIGITAKHVDIGEGYDTLSSTKTASTSRTAVGGTVSIPLLDALRGIQQMGEAAEKTTDGRMLALAAVNAAMSADQAMDAGKSMTQDPRTGVKVSVNLSNSQSQMNSSQSGSNVVGSGVIAGGNINIVAKGAGADSNINVVGSRIEGGGDVSLNADGAINLLSAQNTAHQESTNSNSGWSAGIGFGFGEQNGFTLELAANKGRGTTDGDDVTHTNTSVKSGGTLSLKSGGDTNIKGATASGETVKVNVGGDLNIESLQDTSTYTSKQSSANVGLSVCVPPFCVGNSSVSGGIAQQHMQSEYASVSEQSGIKAGNGGFQVEVKGNTDLVGAIIASTDKAVADGKNTLSTGTLTTSDVKNKAEYDASSINLSGGYGADMGRDANGNASATANRGGPVVASKDGVSATTPVVLFASGNSSSTTYSGISGAAVTITNSTKQQELTGQTAEQAIAAINTDVSSERDGSNKLKPIFDAQEIGVDFEIVGKFVQNVSQFIENRAREIDDKKKQADLEYAAARNPNLSEKDRLAHHENYLQLQQQIKEVGDNWGAGGTYRQIATALVAGISGGVTGSSAQFAQNMVVNYVQQQGSSYIGDLVKKGLKEGSPEHAALHAILGCAGAAASNQSCSAGALGGSASSVLAGLFADSDPNETAIEREAKRNIITSLVTGIAAMSNPNGAATANNAATANIDNNWLATQQYVQAMKEVDAEPNLAKKLAIIAKWGYISARQDLLTASGVMKGFTDGMAGAGLGALDSAVNLLRDPVESFHAMNEFLASDEAVNILGKSVADAFKSQLSQILEAATVGGDENAENVGRQMGQAVALIVQLMAGGGTSSANASLQLSRMGIDVSVKTIKEVGSTVKIDHLKTQITKFSEKLPDTDVPVLDPQKPVVPPKTDVTPPKVDVTVPKDGDLPPKDGVKPSEVEPPPPVKGPDEFIPPGMDRPFRPVNLDHPPLQSVVDAMESPLIKKMVACDSVDCSEIAIKLFDAAEGKGKIIEVRPVQPGKLTLFENGKIEADQIYHQVYTDGRYVYDPRLSSNPIPKGDWEQHIKGMNPEGVKISDNLKGL